MSPLRKRRTNEVSEENPIVEEQAQLDFEGNAENQVAENQESSEVQETATEDNGTSEDSTSTESSNDSQSSQSEGEEESKEQNATPVKKRRVVKVEKKENQQYRRRFLWCNYLFYKSFLVILKKSVYVALQNIFF